MLDGHGAVRFSVAARARRKHNQGRLNSALVVLSAAVIGLATLLVLSAALGAHTVNRLDSSLPDPGQVDAGHLQQSSVLLDAEGEEMAEISSGQRRQVVPSDQLSPEIKDAVVAVEDRRFYEHSGVDSEGIARAAAANVAAGGVTEGGSTITQQLMKTRYLPVEERYENSLSRKAFEAGLALSYEKTHTKRQILTDYLNAVYFGNGAYGAQAAASTYFSKPADDLSLAESATLAGVLNLPGYYDPFENPQGVLDRRDVVLDAMLHTGAITAEEHERATTAGLGLKPDTEEQVPEDLAPYVDAVREELVQTYGLQTVERGGLRVQTTLDPQAQQQAVAASRSALDPDSGDPSSALVSVDPADGAVKALAVRAPEGNRFNLATDARRQPGSTFKAFVLTAVAQAGVSLDREYVSRPLSVDWADGAPPYEVQNYRQAYLGPISVRRATEVSDNSVFVQLALDVGLDAVVEAARTLGIESRLPETPAVAIGGLPEGVSPLKLTSAYATLASGGVGHEPHFVTGVERTTTEGFEPLAATDSGAGGDGEIQSRRVIPAEIASQVTDALSGVVEEGAAAGFERLRAETETVGKTGTSENFGDAWYVGYPEDGAGGAGGTTAADGAQRSAPEDYVSGVWVGYPDSPRPMRGVGGYAEVDGSTVPLDIYADYAAGNASGNASSSSSGGATGSDTNGAR